MRTTNSQFPIKHVNHLIHQPLELLVTVLKAFSFFLDFSRVDGDYDFGEEARG